MSIKLEPVITGQYIVLRKAAVADAEDMYNWRSGYAGRYMRVSPDFSVANQAKWIESRSDKEMNYIIVDKQTQQSVGAISILDLNEADLVGSVGRLLLDEKYLQESKPYGLEALLLTYDYVFNTLNFRKITGEILKANEGMVKLQKFLGMTQEGLLEKHVLIKDAYEDICIMSLFRDKFNDTYRKKTNFLLKSFK